MKLYTYDAGWRGSVAILAESREEAFVLFLDDANPYFDLNNMDKFIETEVTQKGVIMVTAGDS